MKFYKKSKTKVIIRGAAFLILPFILTACTGKRSTQSQQITSKTTPRKVDTTTGTVSSNYYESMIEGGKYKVSQQRGVSISNTNNMNDLMAFDSGLLNYDHKIFSTDKYIFQEGQNLTKRMVTSWLNRKSKDNPEGLNLEDNQSTDPNKRNPLVLQQILEHDFLVKKGTGYNLEGIVLGLSINSIDYYQKEQYGATLKTPIKDEAGEKYAREAADKILSRMRKMDGLKNIPIYLYVYREGPQDSLVGGEFILSAKAKTGDKFTEWTQINEKNMIYPTINNEKPVNQKDADDFNNFKNNVQNFFPNLAGVVAQSHYEGGTLKGMTIKITTQFYSISEITSFTQYCANQANQYLPKEIPLEIDIQSASGTMLAFIARNPTDTGFYTHVFSSY
ncbi:CamS family sex pheromone protein [Xylocopilactobacillus apicola]|uniref:CamS family sex pheromone protein n=1 Tax=Xylocopilactobacillus apicola TaxID=2932184 RepID=A0AAU9DJ23_9LACO|nr:CamS family sex pheromone protein [Xylocopilactobacillus apicola]BDR58456.1 CamS family sex pheromone protein [Xylocopilactobacillus apicola]